MDADLDTLATALYVTTDDLLRAHPERVPAAPEGRDHAADQRCRDAHPGGDAGAAGLHQRDPVAALCPQAPARHVPARCRRQSGYNKRLRKLADTMSWLVSALAAQTSIADDDVWVVDSTPVECARSRETVQRSDLAGWAEYGYCASHSRFFWGLRLHLVCTLHGPPGRLGADRRQGRRTRGPRRDPRPPPPLAWHARARRQIVIADKNYYGRAFEADLDQPASTCSAPPARARNPAPGNGSSNRCARSSSRSTTPSRASSTSNATAARPPPASAPASPNASSP